MKMFLLFSHKLTDEQIRDAKTSLNVNKFIYLHDGLQKKWSNVPPELDSLNEYATPFYEFLKDNAKKGDYVLAQGDFGLTHKIILFCLDNNLIPIYATTKRVSKEIEKNGKKIKVSQFEHVRFRKF